jgi:hypothetical protein
MLNLLLKIKKIFYFFIIFLIYVALHSLFFSINLMCVDLCYKLILINKFTKYKRINDPCCDIKYCDLYLFLNFFSFVFIYYHFFYWIISISWFRVHDIHVIWTCFMSRLRVSHVSPTLPGEIFFLFCFCYLVFCIMLLN